MNDSVDSEIRPRDVANKSSKESLQSAIGMALSTESDTLRLNTQTFNANRYLAVEKIDGYEDLKDHAREIKEQSIQNLPVLIEKLTKSIEARGGKAF